MFTVYLLTFPVPTAILYKDVKKLLDRRAARPFNVWEARLMREKFMRFMTGRYGTDQLNRAMSVVSLVLIVLNLFVRSTLLWLLAVVLLVLTYVRTFSRRPERRRAENERYLRATWRFREAFRNLKDRWSMRRDYAFFRCPSCRAMLRVPRGKGKVRITCRKCGNAFERRT